MVYKKLPKKATYYRKVPQLKRVSTEIYYYTEMEHARTPTSVVAIRASGAIL
jgi:hypothetical protein